MFKKSKIASSIQYSFIVFTMTLPLSKLNAAPNIISQDFRKEGNTAADIKWLMPYTAGGKFKNNTACLTIGATNGTSAAAATPTSAGFIPKCATPPVDDVKNNSGALRLTPAENYRAGGIVSNDVMSTTDGVEITFTSYTYGSKDFVDGRGADGMTFYLLDGSAPPQIGGLGGSIGYGCTNNDYENRGGNGVTGGYLGVGIDEYGNYISGGGEGSGSIIGQNGTKSLAIAGNQRGTIGLRGVGNVHLNYLIKNFSKHGWAGSGINAGVDSINGNGTAKQALLDTCSKGFVHNATTGKITNDRIANYDLLAYKVLPSSSPIGSLTAKTRAEATPISYKIKITPSKMLSFWWSYNGGLYQPILVNQDIEKLNGKMPATLRFGFAGATGGKNNIHEVTCFKAQPANLSVGTSPSNTPDGQFVKGTQVFSGFFRKEQWTGNFTATTLLKTGTGDLVANNKPNWDAACQYLGGTCSATGSNVDLVNTADRVFWTNNSGNQGISLEWNNLDSDTQMKLDAGDNIGKTRLDYIKGVRTYEGKVAPDSSSTIRQRQGLLGDIIHSGAAVVGPPSKTTDYSVGWKDRLYPTTVLSEQNGETYSDFANKYNTRLNIAYIGANDGFLHGYRAGAYAADGKTFIDNDTSKPNDGKEVLSFIPKSVLDRVRNVGNSGLDLSNAEYAHNYYHDATPKTGDVFYGGEWHTWLLSGLGNGGNSIYALDVTDPNYTQSNASNHVIGEWKFNAADAIFKYLGNTYGRPEFVRLHNGQWAGVFGNGWCGDNDASNGNCTKTPTGEAGIYLMLIDPVSGAVSFDFLNTNVGTFANQNGIAEVTPADLDGDNITDYLYAGDLHGNVWRFDVTANNQSQWRSTAPVKIFTTQSGQPITTRIMVSTEQDKRVVLNFGTGQRETGYLTKQDSYAKGTQSLYGIWDSQMTAWNANKTKFYRESSLNSTLSLSNLTQQVINDSDYTALGSDICWADQTGCSDNKGHGWYRDLKTVDQNGVLQYEQVINNPEYAEAKGFKPVVVFNTYIDGQSSIISCDDIASDGRSFGLDVLSGKGIKNVFTGSNGYYAQMYGAMGDVVIIYVDGVPYLQIKKKDGSLVFVKLNLEPDVKPVGFKRLSWREIF